jgi:ABC-2 type transport system ATP-binding protein
MIPENRLESLLQVFGMTKIYGGQTALADVSFDVRHHEILGLIGPNGAGKTTLLEGMAGLLPIDTGTVAWEGTQLPPARRRSFMFYLPDGVRPWNDHYVMRVLAFFGGVYRRSERQIADAADSVGLTAALSKRVYALSKGYLRRLIWALALLAPHPLLLMDEPFDGFDLKQTREMMPLLRELSGSGKTLILSIHQLGNAETVCDRLALLSGGRICGIGTLDELRARTNRTSGGLEEVFLALT